MGTSTPAPLTLYKPDDGELVDVETHLGDNYDSINDWALERETNRYEFLGGLVRTSGNTAAIDDDPEVVVCGSGTISLPADSLIEVRFHCKYFVGGAPGEDWSFALRETNLSGTRVEEFIDKVNPGALPLCYDLVYQFKTTTATSKSWVGTVRRIAGTTANLVAQNGTFVEVYRVGQASRLGDYSTP